MTDWQAIETDREAGLSMRTLSLKYGLPKSTISDHFNKSLSAPTSDTPRTPVGQIGQLPLPTATDIVELARRLIGQLDTIALTPLDLKEHNLLAQALSQYNKVLVTTPPPAQVSGIDWSLLNPDELKTVEDIFAQAEARAGIISIRRQA